MWYIKLEKLCLVNLQGVTLKAGIELKIPDMSSNLKIEIVDTKGFTVKSMLTGGQTASITVGDALPYAIRIWVNSGTGGTISNISLINKSASSSGSSGDGPF